MGEARRAERVSRRAGGAERCRRATRFRLGLASGCLLLAAACFNSGITPRTADILAPRELGGGASFTVASLAPGRIELADGDAATGSSGWRALVHPLGWMIPHVLNTQGWLRLGIAPRLEWGMTAGLQQVGGELRLAVLDEDAGAPISLAVGAAMMYRPFSPVKAPWTGLSVDMSRRFRARASILNLVLTYGPEDHAMRLESHQQRECGGFGEEGCGEYGPPRQFLASQTELRLNAAVGVAFRQGDSSGALSVALVPYFNLWRDLRTLELSCEGCSYLEPIAFEERWGVHLVVGFQFSGGGWSDE